MPKLPHADHGPHRFAGAAGNVGERMHCDGLQERGVVPEKELSQPGRDARVEHSLTGLAPMITIAQRLVKN